VVPSPCFIATAAYGTPLHEDINILRKFRNEMLSTNMPARYHAERRFVCTYNSFSGGSNSNIYISVKKIWRVGWYLKGCWTRNTFNCGAYFSGLHTRLAWLTCAVCATIAAYILPLIIPLSIAVVVIAVIMPKYKKRDMRKRSRGKREEVENEELC